MFGFETPGAGEYVRIRDIQYLGEVKNEYLSFDRRFLIVSNKSVQRISYFFNSI